VQNERGGGRLSRSRVEVVALGVVHSMVRMAPEKVTVGAAAAGDDLFSVPKDGSKREIFLGVRMRRWRMRTWCWCAIMARGIFLSLCIQHRCTETFDLDLGRPSHYAWKGSETPKNPHLSYFRTMSSRAAQDGEADWRRVSWWILLGCCCMLKGPGMG